MHSKELPRKIIIKRIFDDDRVEHETLIRRELEYGQNPNQKAAVYTDEGNLPFLQRGAITKEKQPSLNNMLDVTVAYSAVQVVNSIIPDTYPERNHAATIV